MSMTKAWDGKRRVEVFTVGGTCYVAQMTHADYVQHVNTLEADARVGSYRVILPDGGFVVIPWRNIDHIRVR